MYFVGTFYIQIIIGQDTKLMIYTEISEYKLLVILISTFFKCFFLLCILLLYDNIHVLCTKLDSIFVELNYI